MSTERIEIHWSKDLEVTLLQWIMVEAQLPRVKAEDLATPEMLGRALKRRLTEARQRVKTLRTLLEAAKVPVLDCDVLAAVDRLKSAAAAAPPAK